MLNEQELGWYRRQSEKNPPPQPKRVPSAKEFLDDAFAFTGPACYCACEHCGGFRDHHTAEMRSDGWWPVCLHPKNEDGTVHPVVAAAWHA